MERSRSSNNYQAQFNTHHARPNIGTAGHMGRGTAGLSAEPVQQFNQSAEMDGGMFGRRKTAFAAVPNTGRPGQMG